MMKIRTFLAICMGSRRPQVEEYTLSSEQRCTLIPPGRGVLALCSRGELGLITCDSPMPVHYVPEPKCRCGSADYYHSWSCPVFAWQNNQTNHGTAWVGVHLGPAKAGEPWSSRNPKTVGTIKHTNGRYEVHPVGVNWRLVLPSRPTTEPTLESPSNPQKP